MILRTALAAGLLCAMVSCKSDLPPPKNAVEAENRLAGDPTWPVFISEGPKLTAYADRVSVRAGQSVGMKVSSDQTAQVMWTLYRLGWYGGAGARSLASGIASAGPQPACTFTASTQLVQCPWGTSFSVPIPDDAISGVYLVKLVREDGLTTFIPVTVLDDRPTPLLVQESFATWQAYNKQRGESLYADDSGDSKGGLAVQVSFDRPYTSDYGAGQLFELDYPLVSFLERNGYDVSYTTNLDVSRLGVATLTPHKAFISGAHDEYWDLAERTAIDDARDQGVSILFLGANEANWKTRLSNPGPDGNARIITCYKNELDPVTGPEMTGYWYAPGIDRPPYKLSGVQYVAPILLTFPLRVTDPSSYLFAGTGLKAGDAIPGVIKGEYDGPPPTPAANFSIAASSPVIDEYAEPGNALTGSYRAPSGALVFSSGAIGFVEALNGPSGGLVGLMTANLIQEATGVLVPAGLGPGAAPPVPAVQGPYAKSVATVATGFNQPAAVVPYDNQGTLVVSEPTQSALFLVGPPPASTLQPLAGSGSLNPNVQEPDGVAVGSDGTIYFSDTAAHCIRAIAPGPQQTMTVLAGGDGEAGFVNGSAATARFNLPMGLYLDAAAGQLLVADARNAAVRSVDIATGITQTIAGGPTTSDFRYPTAVVRTSDGRLFIAATGTRAVIEMDSAGVFTRLTTGTSETDDGAGASVLLNPQGGIAWDGQALYVSDGFNGRIRRIIPGKDAASTQVQTLAGGAGRTAADGDGQHATFSLPVGLALAPGGGIYVADTGGNSIRLVQP
jgi:sugar lactone lactonase YvrE